jgi:hypothetical protein|tara:strand:- start:2740 stop:3075 length:336 start_codon:yes stop_codon:yes gene_type:complete
MAVYSNILVDQGADYSASIDVTDNDGDNINLTGYSGAGQIRKSYSSTTAVNFTVTVASPATAGVLNISLSNSQTNAMKAGRYVYDVEITKAGVKTRVLEGQLEITPGVTQI